MIASADVTNRALRRALADARLREEDVAQQLGVSPKTVQRWVAGRTPHAGLRWRLAELLGLPEHELWSHLPGDQAITPDILASYPHRVAVPRDLWRRLFEAAEREIAVLAYSALFLAEDVDLLRVLGQRARDGVIVRLALGDPDSLHVEHRGREEGIDSAMAAKIRNALVLFRPVLDAPNVEIRLHDTVLYNSIFRADGELLVNQHVYGLGAASSPVLRLKVSEVGGLAETYLDSFERVWSSAAPLA